MATKRFGAASLILLLLAGGSAVAQSKAPLADAAEQKDGAKVAALLKQGVDVNAPQGVEIVTYTDYWRRWPS